MEKHVTSLKISKRLKVSGFNKETDWTRNPYDENLIYYKADKRFDGIIKAYQINDILEELPKRMTINNIVYELEISFLFNGYSCVSYWPQTTKKDTDFKEMTQIKCQNASTPQDALALMRIWLKKEGYLK